MLELVAGLVVGWWARGRDSNDYDYGVSFSQPCSFCGRSEPCDGRKFLRSLFTDLSPCTAPACEAKLGEAIAEAANERRSKKKRSKRRRKKVRLV